MNRRRISELFITTAGQKTVNQQHINSLLIPLPPLQEQKRIIEKIDELMKSCELLDEQVKEVKILWKVFYRGCLIDNLYLWK